MYLHSAIFSPSSTGFDGKPQKVPLSAVNKSINQEITTATIVRNTMKDPISNKLQIRGPKQAEALQFVETRILRQQIQSFDIGLHEDARRNYLLHQNDKRKNLQDFQCQILVKLETILKQEMILKGEEVRKYHIGGHDRGTYEIFFRVEPKRFMSEAQLLTALRIAFGSEVIKSEAIVKKIFSSFDFYLQNEMDWRCFLYLLIILMQPTLTTIEMIKHAFALYSSVGILDMTCSEKVKIGAIKDFICAPIQLSKRSYIMNEFDRAWQVLQNTDGAVLQYAAKRSEIMKSQRGDFDPNEFLIPYAFLKKIMTTTAFAKFFEPATRFGNKDSRTWSTILEEEYYHPLILSRIKTLRRELRNEDEANDFVAKADYRKKRFSVQIWQLFRRKRIFLRHILVAYELRCTVMIYGIYIDKWKKICMEYSSSVTIQRVIRGYLARRRRRFIHRLHQKVVRLQKNTRQYMISKKVKQGKYRLYWAASTIQRIFRGRRVRKMAATMIEAYFDTHKRNLIKERERWNFARLVRASIAIQMAMRKFLRRRRMMKKLEQKELQREVELQIQEAYEQARITEDVYKQQVSKWYIQRKEQYDLHALNEQQTAKEKKKIIERKMQRIIEEKARKKALREQQLAKIEEEKIERWIKQWEIKIQETGILKRKQCKNCLVLPETPEDIELKKVLQKNIKGHIKEVLRKADKQKIPMEIPEAFEIATEEMIEEQVQLAMEQARQQMKEEAKRLEQEEQQKKLREIQREKEEKNRKKFWAIFCIQKFARSFLARKRVRQQAYKRYEKFFSIEHHEYYYQDRVTKETFWEKPASLGSYDTPMESYWILIPGKSSDGIPQPSLNYYYNPSTWEQSWIRPYGTVVCDSCETEFAKMYYNEAGYDQNYLIGNYYCPICFHNKVQEFIHWYHIPTKEIYFQQFNGGKTDAIFIDFTTLPVIDYYSFSLEINPSLKASEEEENQSRLEEEFADQRSAGMLIVGSNGSGRAINKCGVCEHCFKRNSEVQCLDCNLFYCESCNRKEHKFAHLQRHERIPLALPDLAEDEEEDEPKQMKFPVLQRSLSSSADYMKNLIENTYDSDEEYPPLPVEESNDGSTPNKQEKKKKRKKKKKKTITESLEGKPKKKMTKKKKKNDDGQTPTDTSDYSDSSPDKVPRKKKKKTPKKPKASVAAASTEEDLMSESEANTDTTPKKKKKMVDKPKKKKKKKTEDIYGEKTEDTESELSSPERLKLPPIARPNTTPVKMLNNNPYLLDSDTESSLDPLTRNTKSAGDLPNARIKNPKKKKKAKKTTSDESESTATPEKTKKKPKKMKSSAEGESSDVSLTGDSKPQKKKKKSRTIDASEAESSLNTEDREGTPKKKKAKKSASSRSPLKTKKKKKSKDTGDSTGESDYDPSSLSESSVADNSNFLPSIPEKKKKKKQSNTKSATPGKKKRKGNDDEFPPISGTIPE